MGEDCEDDYTLAAHRSIPTIILADGAGAARCGGEGARIVTRAAGGILRRHYHAWSDGPTITLGERLVDELRDELRRVADRRGLRLRDFACTLLFAATDGRTFTFGQLGDGKIAVRGTHGGLASPFEAQKGEFHNQTHFVSQSDARSRIQLSRVPAEDIVDCALMSDGVDESLFNRQSKTFAPALPRMMNWLVHHRRMDVERALEDNLRRILGTRTRDDLSMAMMHVVRHMAPRRARRHGNN